MMTSIGKALTAGLLGLVVTITSIPTQAEALGRRERNILAAIGGVAVIGALASHGREVREEAEAHRHAPPPTGYEFAPYPIEVQLEHKIQLLRYAYQNAPFTIKHDAQRNLKAMGFYNGRLDGIWGRGTERALEGLLLNARGNFDRVHDNGSASRFLQDLALFN